MYVTCLTMWALLIQDVAQWNMMPLRLHCQLWLLSTFHPLRFRQKMEQNLYSLF